MFSTHKIWLPEPPENSILNSTDDLLNNLVIDINFGKYVVIGGEDELNKDLKLENLKLTDSVENIKQSTLFNQLRQVTPRLRELELMSIDQQQQRMEYEEQFGGTKDKPISFQSTTAAKKVIEDVMKGTSKDARGYMVWLKAKDGIDDRQPEPLISLDLIEHILKTFSDEDYSDDNRSNNNEKKKRQRNDAVKQLLSNIKIIVRTAKSVEHNLTKTHLYSTTSQSDFTYDHKILNQKEVFYYQSRQSVEQVLNIHLQMLKEQPAHFEWIKLNILSEESRRNIELSKLETKESMEKLIKLAKSLLMKENHDKSDGELVMTGATFDSRPKQRKKAAKLTDTGSSSSAVQCAINECNEVASTICDFHDTVSNETGKLMKCKEAGVRFCIFHGPAHEQHAHQSFKVSMIEGVEQQLRFQTVISNVKARLEESKAKQKSKKETRKKNIDTLLQSVAEHVDRRTVLTKQSEAKKDRVIAKNNQILNLVNSVLEEANQASLTSSSPVPEEINKISSTEVLVTEEEFEKTTHSPLGIKSSSANPSMAISPQLYNKSKSRSLKSVKVPDLAIELSEMYHLPYRCMLNVFNGINEPQSSFMNTFNHNQYRHWLPDLLVMYDIPLTKVASVFDHTESNLPESETFVREMKEKMKKEKIRTNFLVAVYNYITTAL